MRQDSLPATLVNNFHHQNDHFHTDQFYHIQCDNDLIHNNHTTDELYIHIFH